MTKTKLAYGLSDLIREKMKKIKTKQSGRIDKVLSQELGVSRNQVERLIESGLVCVDDKVITKGSFKVGEGNSDLGLFCSYNNEFIAGSMYYIVDKLIEKKLDMSYYAYKENLITFIPKVELVKKSKKLPPYTSKKDGKGTGLFTVNAVALAKIAKEKSKELKDELEHFGISYEETNKINEMIKNGQIDIDKIDMPSFRYFVDALNRLL